jgi:UDP-glucose 4-epimerase
MRVVVTGSAGFIGSRLVELLLGAGHTVLGIDNLLLGQPAPAQTPRQSFLQADICDAARIHEAFADFGPDRIVHLAAIHHIPTCERNAPEAMRVNVVGTQVVLDAATSAQCHSVVFASSGAVYDWRNEPLVPCVSPTRPSDTYSASKLANEFQIDVWCRRQNGVATIARIFNTIGPNDRNAHLIPDILAQFDGGITETVVRLGNVTPRRDYIYVGDTATALLRMVEADLGTGTHTFNIGTGSEHSVLDVVAAVAEALGRPYQVAIDPAKLRSVDRLHQCADITATREALRWAPVVALAEGVRLTVSEC